MEEYKKGDFYEGLGTYLGIIKHYPYGEDYFLRLHKFAEPLDPRSRDAAKINEILIEKVQRSDR